ncbi:PGN_0703 family putative restriction endonuclease [Rhodoplanes azumiensis]|uniref:PD-(D/E)XK nuclease-like domain-containing protein n=1 Tax=Rhodoplanes azumiensis TaxID=1897628 RepID=A0ABW5AGX4_9BRAD
MSIELRVPFIPETTLRKHQVFEAADSRFRSAARLRQALWREQNGWPIGGYTTAQGKRRTIGNCVSAKAAQAGANFILPEIAQLVRRELAYREDGALFDEARLVANLLSSTPVLFNSLGPLKLDLKLATRVFRRLLPGFVQRVTDIQFEHAPDRGSPRFLADYTAFDALVKCKTPAGADGFIAIEVKYSEGMNEPEARLRARYDQVSSACGLFKDGTSEALRANPLQQLWRQHMLAQMMVNERLYPMGRYVLIAPILNSRVARAVNLYRDHLVDAADKVPFVDFSLEAVLTALKEAGAAEIAAVLNERYCDFSSLHALI